jgi:ketosteroid isomerase-like protein
MSQENVEVLRWLYGEWAKGDLWALRHVADSSIEWEWSAGLASVSGEPRVCHGLDEIATATREWLAVWDRYWMTAEQFIDTDDEIVVLMRVHARARSSDDVLEQRIAAVWTLRDGRAVRVRYFDDRAEALEAVGLSQ